MGVINKMLHSEWNGMRLHGWSKLCHTLYMLITFPVRKPLYMLGIIIVLIAIPLIYGIRINDSLSWYKDKLPLEKMNEITSKTSKMINENLSSVKNNVTAVLPEKFKNDTTKAQDKEEQVKFVSWNVAAFKKAKYEPQPLIKRAKKNNDTFIKSPKVEKQYIATKPQVVKKSDEYIMSESDEVADNNAKVYTYSIKNLSQYYVQNPYLNLQYLSEPEELFDEAVVDGANSLFLADTFIYLYGIYSDPAYYDEDVAKEYLEKLTNGKKVYCAIVAYAVQGQTATALCFVDNIFINGAMVNADLAKNVALR